MTARLLAWPTAACLLLFAAGCAKENTFAPPPPPPVTVAHPAQRDVTIHIPFPGDVRATATVELRARVRGFLKSVDFEAGTLVKEGQRLFTIEPEPYEAELLSAKALLEQAVAADRLAEAKFKRMKQAYATEAVSEIDVLVAEAEKDSSASSILGATATVQRAALDLSYTVVTSPINGRISRHYIDAGNLVGVQEASLLAEVVAVDPLHVFFTIDERVALNVLRGKIAGRSLNGKREDILVELANGTRYEHPATPDYVDPTVNRETGTLTVRAVVDNPDGHLLPGMFVRALIPKAVPQAILVPQVAILRDLSGPYVLVVNAETNVEQRQVTLGPRVDREQIVTKGLAAEDRVIVAGVQRARPGAPVTPQEAKPEPPASNDS